MPTLAQQTAPTKEPASPKPDPADCCTVCGTKLPIDVPIWIHADGRGTCAGCGS